ncbi:MULTISPECIES: hypothetical protein [Sphingobacterium]|uniref:Lipoprotein n=1 Tax=Sphingobacterium populi TaxID=1812824 RepID=A0ABW5UG88_9SPHI|nr:hypothetical protein [Sphingobacterium sp. CFCC 11742]
MRTSLLLAFFTVAIILTSSCAALFRKYDNYMQEWKGQDEELVYKVYGPPMRTQELRDGRKLVAYDFQSSGAEQPVYCSINFELKDSTVMSAKYDGNLSAVQRNIKGPNGAKLVD